MAMKFKSLYHFGNGARTHKGHFKWQWAVFYEFNWSGEWERHMEIFPDREKARAYIRNQMMCHRGLTKPIPFTCFRNIKMRRRLIQASWEDYNDSYTWNAGNGKR